MSLSPEDWNEPRQILVILAHPDDPEFFCGATIARWTSAGHRVEYCLLTRGESGNQDPGLKPEQVAAAREQEQYAAAAVLNVAAVRFLDFPDGYLTPDLGVRREVVRVIRARRPDVVVTCDPTYLYTEAGRLNHADHRAAGQAVLDGVFPGAGNRMFFPELLEAGLEPHTPHEVWVSLPQQPNLTLDVTPLWEQKLRALHCHVSQIGDPAEFDERMRSRRAADSPPEAPRYEEKFRRLFLK